VQKTGYYLPQFLFGNALVAIGAGLFATFTPWTSDGEWIGYQIIAGGGRGVITQLVSWISGSTVGESVYLYSY
jgi:hypothetical protein